MNYKIEKKKAYADSVSVPSELEQEIEELIRRYPQRRSAAVMVLHRLQEHFGWLSPAWMEWSVERLGVEPIAVWELVTFYPMFRERPFGRFHFKICRTLSRALAGSHELHRWLCERLGWIRIGLGRRRRRAVGLRWSLRNVWLDVMGRRWWCVTRRSGVGNDRGIEALGGGAGAGGSVFERRQRGRGG